MGDTYWSAKGSCSNPGGGITFLVDVEKVMVRAFTYVPTPATVVPLEYTMRLKEYLEGFKQKDKERGAG
jgi:hypothetical protein